LILRSGLLRSDLALELRRVDDRLSHRADQALQVLRWGRRLSRWAAPGLLLLLSRHPARKRLRRIAGFLGLALRVAPLAWRLTRRWRRQERTARRPAS
jgi:hypothetical protein